MFHVALYQPEIPPNTGNIIRLCANVGAALHLIRPYGFSLDDRRLRRAGLDYSLLARVFEHESLGALMATLGAQRLFAATTRGTRLYSEVSYRPGDVVLFGPETRGLPRDVIEQVKDGRTVRIPMRAGNRSLNLSNAVSVVVYEMWRQNAFTQGS